MAPCRALLLVAAALLVACDAASATKVQWNVSGDHVNYPFASPYPPYVIRTTVGSDPDRVVIVTNSGSAGWELTAFAADSGAKNWTVTVAPPDPSNAGLSQLTSGLPHSQQLGNSLSMLFMQLGGWVVALDGATGRQLWQHATYNASTPKITGWSGAGGPPRVYLTSAFTDNSRGTPTPKNYIEALDAATGELKWANFTGPPPGSGLPLSDTAAVHGVTATPGGAVYAQGPRVYLLAAADGKQQWMAVVSTGQGTGLNPNVTSVVYVAPSDTVPTRPAPMLLLTSATWDQTRFMAYQLNTTNSSTPPSVGWQTSGNNNFEGSLSDGLQAAGLGVPQLSVVDGVFIFWSNRTSYDASNGGKPMYGTFLVARALRDGGVVWAQDFGALGFSTTPVSPPIVNVGVMAVTTARQLVVMDAGSGFLRYGMDQAPYQPTATGGQYTYVPVTTFANDWGHLAAVRCLGSQQPGTLCLYNGYEGKASSAAQRRWQPAAATRATAAAAAAVAATWLLL